MKLWIDKSTYFKTPVFVTLFLCILSCKAPVSEQPLAESSEVQGRLQIEQYSAKEKVERGGRTGIAYYLWATPYDVTDEITKKDPQFKYNDVPHYCMYYYAHEVRPNDDFSSNSKIIPPKYDEDGIKLPVEIGTFSNYDAFRSRPIRRLTAYPVNFVEVMSKVRELTDLETQKNKDIKRNAAIYAFIAAFLNGFSTDHFKKTSAELATKAASAVFSCLRTSKLKTVSYEIGKPLNAAEKMGLNELNRQKVAEALAKQKGYSSVNQVPEGSSLRFKVYSTIAYPIALATMAHIGVNAGDLITTPDWAKAAGTLTAQDFKDLTEKDKWDDLDYNVLKIMKKAVAETPINKKIMKPQNACKDAQGLRNLESIPNAEEYNKIMATPAIPTK